MTTTTKRRILMFACLMTGFLGLAAVPARSEEAADSRNRVSEERIRRDVTFLASDECEGRGPLTKGIGLASDSIANEFKKAGLKPGNPNGTYFQTFNLAANTLLDTPTLVLKGPRGQVIELKPGVHFEAMGLGSAGTIKDAPVVFAGYGVSSEGAKYDDFQNVEVDGKVLVLLRNVPRADMAEFGNKVRPQAPFSSKLTRAKSKKALGVLFVNEAQRVGSGDTLLPFSFTSLEADGTPGPLPAVHLRRSFLETMLKGNVNEDLADLEKAIDRDWKPQSVELKGWTASLVVKSEKSSIKLRNVVGMLEGAGPLATQTVVVGAHYDHLGYGGTGGSLGNQSKPAIHHGADDNASGSASVMELARRFAAMPKREGRRLVFMTFSGEELGLLGSKHYCKEPLYPLDQTSAMFNLDMVGRLKVNPTTKKEHLKIEGANTAKVFDEILNALSKNHGFNLDRSKTMPPNSDHFSFYQKKVPVLFFWTGVHEDYHKPSDTADKINVAGMRRIIDLSEEVVQQLATQEKQPEYLKVDVSGGGGSRPGGGPRLGVQPAYDAAGKEGLLIDGASAGSPAAKAGMKQGDLIVQLGGKPVKNIQGYMQIMGGFKKGDTIEVGIVRDGKPMTLKATLE